MVVGWGAGLRLLLLPLPPPPHAATATAQTTPTAVEADPLLVKMRCKFIVALHGVKK
jgi:hypothetical protein